MYAARASSSPRRCITDVSSGRLREELERRESCGEVRNDYTKPTAASTWRSDGRKQSLVGSTGEEVMGGGSQTPTVEHKSIVRTKLYISELSIDNIT